MIRLKVVFFAAFLPLFLGTKFLSAQTKLVFKSITVDNGLPQNSILSVMQDKTGYLWIGTFDGLSRFNGIDFKIYKTQNNDSTSLSSNKVTKMCQDRLGNIWIGTINCLNLFNPNTETFKRFRLSNTSSNNGVESLTEAANGQVLIGTDRGLYYVKSKNNDGHDYALYQSNICRGDKITCLFNDRDQNTWLGMAPGLKIYSFLKKRFVPLPQPLQSNKKLMGSVIRTIIQDNDRNYWIGTETDGLFYYDVKNQTCFNYTQDNGLLSNTVRAVLEQKNGVIWVGTKKGLNIIDKATGQISSFVNDPFEPNSLTQNSIRCIYKDNEDNIWLGTFNGGLNCVFSQFDNFRYLGLKSGKGSRLSYGIVNSVITDTDGSFWIGTDDGGLNHLDNNLENNRVYYQYNGASRELLGNSIKSIALHHDANKLWVATGSGLVIFDKKTGGFQKQDLIPKPVERGSIQNYILLKDKTGLWIGTSFSGLYYLPDNGKLVHFPAAGNYITALFQDDQYLWIGNREHGLSKLDLHPNVISSYQTAAGGEFNLASNVVISIFKDSQQRLWLGTEGGGLIYDDVVTNRFNSLNEGLGISNNTIHSILEDHQGRLWMGTNKGLTAVKFNTFRVPFRKDDLIIENYTVADGLQSNQFARGAAAMATNGDLLFAGINGVTSFNPGTIKLNNIKPRVVFTDLLIYNKPVSFTEKGSPLTKPIDVTDEITLRYSQAYFSIKYTALNYINPGKNQFAIKMEGLANQDWQYVGNQQVATYTNLDPGTYYFKIKAANNDGVWNNIPRSLKIIVLPPWYKTWYAFVAYAAIALLLLYLFNYYTKKNERLKNELRFESLNHIKDQEIAQKQLNLFVNISHEIKTPISMIMAPLERLMEMNIGDKKVNQQLALMQRSGERLIRLINQLLDKKKLETGNMQLQAAESNLVSFIEEVRLAFSDLAKVKNITLDLEFEKTVIPVWFDKDKLEKVLYNLLSNSIKFTADYGRVVVAVKQLAGSNEVIITVTDDGCGIAPDHMDKIFTQFYRYEGNLKIEGSGLGLAFCKDLIELHHGEISIESQPETSTANGCTRVTIVMPLGRAHLKDYEIAGNTGDGEDIAQYIQTEKSIKAQFQLKKQQILLNEQREKLSMLIVEDNPDVLEFIKDGFAAEFEVLQAVNGLAGLEVAINECPDVIISDVMMPGMNGVELCRKLKSDMATSHIPVVLLTARTQPTFKMEGLETGADDYITKPFSFNLLEARVWNLIENRQKLRKRYQKEITLAPQNIAVSNLDGLFLNKLMDYIEQHITDPELSVEQLSSVVSMSKSAFYKKIKSLTNQTGIEFIRTFRIKRAGQLLAQGQLTVNEVAYQVGFMDVDYFRKCFKEHFNYNPKEHPVVKDAD